MAKKQYDEGAQDWREKGGLDPAKIASRDYRKGAQDERTRQVDDELRRQARKGW